MILRFFPHGMWEADPAESRRLLIEATNVAGSKVSIARLGSLTVVRWSVRVNEDVGSTRPYNTYNMLVGRPSQHVVLMAPHDEYTHWSVLINHQARILMPGFDPTL